MKELTIEQKAKRYDEVINRMKHYVVDEYGCSRIKVTYVFPELTEAEDERIRKFLHHTFTAQYLAQDKLGKWHGEPVSNILAWLEKQSKIISANSCKTCKGEQKPIEWSEEDERIYQSIMDDTVQENQLDDRQTKWLSNIKYRYVPQPKQEWSEEELKEYINKYFENYNS